MSENDPAFRLAFRREGGMLNTYYARVGTMEGALLVASIKMSLIEARPDIFDRYKAIMTDALGAAVEAVSGGAVKLWSEQRAPEHERSGRG